MQHDPLLLAGQVHSRRASEAEAVDPVVKPPGSQAHPDLVRADVARDLEYLGHRQSLVAM